MSPAGEAFDSPDFAARRSRMVQTQLGPRGIDDPRVLAAMERVPRHRFVPAEYLPQAYEDHPLPIGWDQTISQPYIVAWMSQLAQPTANSRALDVGTGSGYQAAILAELCQQVYTLEILPPLAEAARQRLTDLGYRNFELRCGDAHLGWPEQAPFDLIVAAAAPRQVPERLLEQLAEGGRLVIPIGGPGAQEMLVFEKLAAGQVRQWRAGAVAFVPMTGGLPRPRH